MKFVRQIEDAELTVGKELFGSICQRAARSDSSAYVGVRRQGSGIESGHRCP
jgi:hypothetical protein